MGLLSRRKLPAAARPKLDRDERIIAWASISDSPQRAVVVTTLGLWLPGHDRLGWHQIHKATWSNPRLTVIPSMLVSSRDGYDVMADDIPLTADLADPGAVPEEIRKRVTRSVAQTFHEAVPGGGVRVVARRTPGINGVRWHVRYDLGTDPESVEVVEATNEIVAAFAVPEPD